MTWLKFIKQSMRNGYMTHPEKTQVSTGGSQTTRENINTGPELITRMIENTNNLLENLDIRGILSLLKNRLNAKIQDLKEENFYLRNRKSKRRKLSSERRTSVSQSNPFRLR